MATLSRGGSRLTRRLVRGAVIAGLALAAVTLLPATARDVQAAQDQGNAKKKYVATREITVDKVTGQLRKPTATETQELVDSLRSLIKPIAEGAAQVALPSGAMALNLDGQAAPVMLARPNADGTTEVRCVTSFEEALEFLGLVEDPSQQ